MSEMTSLDGTGWDIPQASAAQFSAYSTDWMGQTEGFAKPQSIDVSSGEKYPSVSVSDILTQTNKTLSDFGSTVLTYAKIRNDLDIQKMRAVGQQATANRVEELRAFAESSQAVQAQTALASQLRQAELYAESSANKAEAQAASNSGSLGIANVGGYDRIMLLIAALGLAFTVFGKH